MLNNSIHRQPRFGYIPLFGLLLANVLSNSVLAKYAPLGALRLSYEPLPWLHKPTHYQNAHESYHYWHPVGNSYGPAPISSSETANQHIHHHHQFPGTTQQQIVNIHERPTEIIIGDTDTEATDQTETSSPLVIIEEKHDIPLFKNSLEKPEEKNLTPESRSLPSALLAFLANATTPSTKKVKRGTGKYTKTRKNNKYISQKKRRPTTTSDYYYDSYEDTTTTRRYQPKKKTQQRRPLVDSYEESESSISQSYSDLSENSQEYEYDSYELTTKPHKKRRRTTTTRHTTNRPKRIKDKYKFGKHQTNPSFQDDVEYDTERINPTTTTESLKIRHQELLLRQQEHLQRQQEALLRQQEFLQRQQQTDTTTESTESTSTTTAIPTVVTVGNLSMPNNVTNTTGYGKFNFK